jgi:cytoskeletal protein CcmA (bactofilin family)
MKTMNKFLIVLLMAVLLFVPTQTAAAKGLFDGQVVFGNNYTVNSGETLNGDLVVFGGTITIKEGGKVMGSVVLMGGSITVDGEVTKDMIVFGGAVDLGETAHVRGNLVTMGAPITKAGGARVDGDTIDNPTPPNIPDMPTTPGVETPNIPNNSDFGWFTNPLWEAVMLFVRAIILAMLALLVALFLPVYTRRIGEAATRQPAQAGGLGFLTLVGFIVSVVALALFSVFIITILLTVPLIVVLAIAFSAAIVFGWIGLGTEIGLRFAGMAQKSGGEIPLPMAAAVGTFLLSVVVNGIGFIPCVGWIANFVVGMLGLGAVMMTRFGSRPVLFAAPAAEGRTESAGENL